MHHLIGIRREDKNKWERRVPLVPEHIKELKEKHSIEALVQPSKIRVFSNEDYIRSDTNIQEDLSPCSVIFAVKEIPLHFFEPKKTYVFFSHTIKGQLHNMPMLKRMLELKCQLIDYENIVDERGKRLLFFGKYAGFAGMIDALWALGQRLNSEDIQNPFCKIKQAYQYKSLAEAKKAISEVGERINANGVPESITPLICGFAGYGNVSQGAQEILDLLPVKEIKPEQITSVGSSRNLIYKVVFKEEHIVELKSRIKNQESKFKLQDYYEYPEKYRGIFERYIPHLTLLMNCIYWDNRYPRLVTKEYLRHLYSTGRNTPWRIPPRLRVIGDISCDIEGAIECTVQVTDPDNPIFVYDLFGDKAINGCEGKGPVVLAVDNLPCELPRESSTYFSEGLKPLIPEIVSTDFSLPWRECKLSQTLKNAVIVYHGELTPNYKYLTKYLESV